MKLRDAIKLLQGIADGLPEWKDYELLIESPSSGRSYAAKYIEQVEKNKGFPVTKEEVEQSEENVPFEPDAVLIRS